jgi:hypothetical protein
VEVPLVLSHLVFRRDVGGHGLAAGVVGHNLLLERHHLVLVCWVGLLLAMVTPCSVSSSCTGSSLVLRASLLSTSLSVSILTG